MNEYPSSLRSCEISKLSPPSVVNFIDQEYRYKSIATKIPHDAGLVPIPYTGQKIFHGGSKRLPYYEQKAAHLNHWAGNIYKCMYVCMHMCGGVCVFYQLHLGDMFHYIP